MEHDKDPESSPAHEVELDPEEEARRIILARRARFVAIALVSAGVGTAACGGETGDSSRPQPCLSLAATGGSGGAQVCLSATGGAVPCLSIAAAGGVYGTGATTGSGGVPQPCLEPLYTGGYGGVPQPCLTPVPTGGAPQIPHDSGVEASTDAAPVPVDAAPVPCLSIPASPNSGNDS